MESVDLPPDSPLRKLRNCILFATAGDRPEADKMSGGDLDGDLYLVIWDKRLTKYADDIAKEEPADYECSPLEETNMTSPREDWIEHISRFDNFILGVVDKAFFNTAREKGITSSEAKRLNAIFTSVVDKNPTQLRELEKLAGSSYITGSSASTTDNSCIWEKMLQIQLDYGRIIQGGKIAPDLEDYSTFQKNLDEECPRIVSNIQFHHGHFSANVNPQKLASILQVLNTKSTYEDPNPNCSDRLAQSEQDINRKFKVMHKKLEEDAQKIFEKALAEWDDKRKEVLKKLTRERELKQKGLAELDKEEEKLRNSFIVFNEKMEGNQRSSTHKHIINCTYYFFSIISFVCE